jgi:CPA1 family monovalent cation:H+ antiporter
MKTQYFTFSTFSVLISTFIIGFSYYLLTFITNELIHACYLCSDLPTDPIAVLSILKGGVSKSLDQNCRRILFNDGVAVVVFITILKLAQPGV